MSSTPLYWIFSERAQSQKSQKNPKNLKKSQKSFVHFLGSDFTATRNKSSFLGTQKPRRRGRPTKTIYTLIKEDTGLEGVELRLMHDRNRWREHIMSPQVDA